MVFTSRLRYALYGAVASASLISLSVSAGTADGVFGDYFTRMTGYCDISSTNSEVLTGLAATSDGFDFGTKRCTSLRVLIGRVFASFPTPIGQAIIGFDAITGNPKYGSVNWQNSAGNISYTGGNVGIGTTSPAAKLDVAGNIRATGLEYGNGLARTESRDNAGLQGDAGAKSGFFETPIPTNYPTGATSWWHLIDSRHSNNANNYAMQIAGSFFDQNLYFRKTNSSATQGWNKIVAENTAGNVGIGTSTPLSKLDVNGPIRALGSSIFAQNNWSTDYWAAPIQVREAMYGATASYLAPRISLHWGGVVASQIGLESSGRIAILNNPGTGYESLVANTIYPMGGISDSAGARMDAGGGWLRTYGQSGWYNGTYGVGMYATQAGYIQTYNNAGIIANLFVYVSDRRLKKNITPLTNSLEKILSLSGYSFDWIKDGKHDVGVIAQEVEKVFPAIVNTNPETGMKGVEYGNLVAPIIEAIKELANEKTSQEREIQDLKIELNELKTIVQKLAQNHK